MTRFCAALVAILVLQGSATAAPVAKAGSSVRGARTPDNAALQEASSPFEDMIEFAVAADTVGMDRALTAYGRYATRARAALGDHGRAGLDSLVAVIHTARRAHDGSSVAFAAAAAYRILVDGLDERTLVVPKAVALLDWVGFELGLQAGAASPDWVAMQRTGQEANTLWASVRNRVKDHGLQDVVDATFRGMTQAIAAHDAPMAAFAAEIDLGLVDLLEAYFTRARASAPAAGK